MSIILDALRKSEAARRRSETPDLFSTMPANPAPAPAPRRKPGPAIAIATSLAAVVLTATAWWLLRNDALRNDSLRSDAPSTQAVADSRGETADAPARAEISTQDSDPLAHAALPSAPTAASPAIATVPAPTMSSTALTSKAPSPAISPPASDPVANTPTASSPVPASIPSAATTAPPVSPQTTPRTASEPVTVPLSPAMPIVSGEAPLRVADLDPAARRQLPPLKLSMHLWNEVPAQRFVILDGQRLREGDLLGEIVVERIDDNGAILVWRGQRIRIEVR